MFRRHEKGRPGESGQSRFGSPAKVTNSNFTRSDREIVALFDAAVYRALLAKQSEIIASLAGGRRV